MDVELLVVPDCPHQGPAVALVRRVLEELDMGAEVTVTEIGTDHEATRRRFTGSPTFLVNGTDVLARPGADFAVACRLYATPTGLAPLPTLSQLSAALQRAAGVSTEPPADPLRTSR